MANETTATLKRALNQVAPDGSWQYSDDEVRYFIVFVLLMGGTDLTHADSNVLQMVGAVAERAGVNPNDTPDQAKATLLKHFAANPVNPELRKNVEGALQELLTLGGAAALGREFGKFAGEKRAGVLGGDGARPAGAVGAGPMARFTVQVPPKK